MSVSVSLRRCTHGVMYIVQCLLWQLTGCQTLEIRIGTGILPKHGAVVRAAMLVVVVVLVNVEKTLQEASWMCSLFGTKQIRMQHKIMIVDMQHKAA